jgi:putative salt-induced outer membrane protein
MRRTVQTVATLLGLIATTAVAQDKPPEKAVKITGDLSFAKTGGNTDVLSLGTSDKLEWKASTRFTLKQQFGWVYGTTDGEKSANALLAGLRGEYSLSKRVLLFLGFNYDYNLFAGVKRRFEEYAGLGFVLVDKPRDILRFDLGISQFQEWAVNAETSSTFTAGRVAGDYKHLFGEKAYFQQILEYVPNFKTSEDYRINSETALVAPLSGNVALKVGYIVRYRGLPPEDVKKTDTVFRTGIQVTY